MLKEKGKIDFEIYIEGQVNENNVFNVIKEIKNAFDDLKTRGLIKDVHLILGSKAILDYLE